MGKYTTTYEIRVQSNTDISLIEDYEEREELEEIVDNEIAEAQEQIELWANEYKADYELIENHRCILKVEGIYANSILPGTIKAIENEYLDETYISVDIIEG